MNEKGEIKTVLNDVFPMSINILESKSRGAVAFHALMTSLCPNGFNTHKTEEHKYFIEAGYFSVISE